MELTHVVVIGAGTMGAGIAQWFAQQMVNVELVDAFPEQLKKAQASIHQAWDKLVEKEKLTACQVSQMKSLLDFKSTVKETSPKSHLVIEAIIEDMAAKHKLFQELDNHYDETSVIASNTSSFPITQLSQAVSSKRTSRFLGLHFFNPAPLMKLVEVICGKETSPELASDFYQWFESHGKVPAQCQDSPGFIVNRVARNFYGEPLRIAEKDDEFKMKEIDRLLREVGQFKMGPFELMDLIGIDVNYAVTCSVWDAFQKEPRFAPHALQKQMVDEGRLGRKTKRGYYTYE